MILIANWKQNKTFADLKEWVSEFDSHLNKANLPKVEVVVAPSFPLISPLKMIVQAYPYIKIASQDISKFEKGAHTGEVGAFQLTNIADYSIIGHSERRKMGETVDDVAAKISMAEAAQIKPVVCFSNEGEAKAIIDMQKDVYLAYEPASAISTAENSTGPMAPNGVKQMVDNLGLKSVIYGGSVDRNSIENYVGLDFISGFLVGSASLDPVSFADLVNKSA